MNKRGVVMSSVVSLTMGNSVQPFDDVMANYTSRNSDNK